MSQPVSEDWRSRRDPKVIAIEARDAAMIVENLDYAVRERELLYECADAIEDALKDSRWKAIYDEIVRACGDDRAAGESVVHFIERLRAERGTK